MPGIAGDQAHAPERVTGPRVDGGAVFRASCEAMIVLDQAGRLLAANLAAGRLLAGCGDQLVGRRLDDLAAAPLPASLTGPGRTAIPAEEDCPLVELTREDGSRLKVEFTASDELAPGQRLWLIRPAGDLPSAAVSGASTQLRSAGGLGSWEWDLASDAWECSDHARALFGIDPLVRISGEQILALVHPDDRAGFTSVLESARAARRSFSHEYRVMRMDGTVRVIASQGEVLLDEDENPSRLLGTLADVTDSRQAEIERRNLAAVLDTSDDAITTCSLEGVFLSWNRGAEKLYGYTAEEAIGQPLDLIIPLGERANDHVNWERLLNDEPVRSLETVRVTKDGRTVVVSVTRSLIVDATRGVIGVASVGRDITEHKRAQALLAAAHAEAVAASEMKSRFLANMSHEIRTPMNGVIGMNELLLDTDLDAEQRSYAEQIARSGEDMMRIISDILDISKIEAGQIQLDAREFELHEAVEQACAVPGFEARAKGLLLDLQIGEEVPRWVLGDGQRLRQVLLNLVSNAVKFTAQGAVAVRVRGTKRSLGATRVRFEVSDTGIGIDPAVLDRMFEPFTQADASTTRSYGGTGLGLAIARDLVELMGGTIGASSDPGRGSKFWFELDLGARPSAATKDLAALDAHGSPAPSRPSRAVARDGLARFAQALTPTRRAGAG